MDINGIIRPRPKNIFAIRAGIAATAMYYISREGVWKDSKESLKVYKKINEALEPYFKEVKQQLPLELPKIPESGQMSTLSKQYWNNGVTATCKFLSELDVHIKHWSSTGYHHLVNNPEIQKFFDSFSNSVPQSSQETSKK